MAVKHTKRAWYAMRDDAGIVPHSLRLTKKEAEYIFRLADCVRVFTECGECGVKAGENCIRKKDKQPMSNHSSRVTQARLLFVKRILPKLDRLLQTLCSTSDGPPQIVINAADGCDVDCMTCLVIAAQQGVSDGRHR